MQLQQLGEFVVNHWDLFLALVLLIAMIFGGNINSRLRGFTNVEPANAVKLINHDDALILDVRENNEVSNGMIMGALHIPLGGLKNRLSELEEHKDKPVIVGCRSGHRSGMACGQLKKAGFETVYNLKGGIMAWQNAGMPLATETKERKSKKKKQKS